MQENVSYCQVCFSNLKMRLFSQVSLIFTVIQSVWLATNSQNAILNNFEEYYIWCIIRAALPRIMMGNSTVLHRLTLWK